MNAQRLVLGIKEGVNGQPELWLKDLLSITGSVILVHDNGKRYILRQTPKGGLQLCAEDMSKSRITV